VWNNISLEAPVSLPVTPMVSLRPPKDRS